MLTAQELTALSVLAPGLDPPCDSSGREWHLEKIINGIPTFVALVTIVERVASTGSEFGCTDTAALMLDAGSADGKCGYCDEPGNDLPSGDVDCGTGPVIAYEEGVFHSDCHHEMLDNGPCVESEEAQ